MAGTRLVDPAEKHFSGAKDLSQLGLRRRIEYQTHTYARTHTVPDMLEEEEEEEASRSSLSRRRTQESYVVSES